MPRKNRKIRKPRTDKIKKVDLLYPVDVTKLGGEEDPCFGKLHDPKTPECQRCGDCELCQIVLAQKMHVTRGIIEKNGKFRDVEEEKIYLNKEPIKTPLLNIKKAIRATLRKHKKIEHTVVIRDVAAAQNTSKVRVNKILTKMLKATDKFKLKNGYYIWTEK